MTAPCTFAVDRSMTVPPGRLVRTGYVEIDAVRLGNREPMSVGDVERAHNKVIQMGPNEQWPCPVGRWEGDRFTIADGRHQFVASLMAGRTHILVAWLEDRHA